MDSRISLCSTLKMNNLVFNTSLYINLAFCNNYVVSQGFGHFPYQLLCLFYEWFNFCIKKSDLNDVIPMHQLVGELSTHIVMSYQLNQLMRNDSIFGLKKLTQVIWHQCIGWWVRSTLLSSYHSIHNQCSDATLSEPNFCVSVPHFFQNYSCSVSIGFGGSLGGRIRRRARDGHHILCQYLFSYMKIEI